MQIYSANQLIVKSVVISFASLYHSPHIPYQLMIFQTRSLTTDQPRICNYLGASLGKRTKLVKTFSQKRNVVAVFENREQIFDGRFRF